MPVAHQLELADKARAAIPPPPLPVNTPAHNLVYMVRKMFTSRCHALPYLSVLAG